MDRLYNEGDLVYLTDLAPNRYICEKVNLKEKRDISFFNIPFLLL